MASGSLLRTVAFSVASLLFLPGCNGNGSPIAPSSQMLRLEDITTSASVADIPGTRRAGAAPAQSGGPTIAASGNQIVVNGGTTIVTVSSASPFQTVYMQVGAKAAGLSAEGAGSFEGFYEIRLPVPQTIAAVLLTFPQTIPLPEFDLQFAAADPTGAVGPYVGVPTRLTEVGTGDVQVTLSWDVDSDVDLHVIAPGGEEVYYAQREAAGGGTLDLDSNAGCQIDGVRNENITWPVGRAPHGQYTVRVDYWSSCGVGRTNYTVRVNNGGSAQIFTGSFTGSGDQGGRGAGRTITTFER